MHFGSRDLGGQNAVAFSWYVPFCLDGANCGDARGSIRRLLCRRVAGGSVAEIEPLVLRNFGSGRLSRRHGANGETAVSKAHEPAIGLGHAVGGYVFVFGTAGFARYDGALSGSTSHPIDPECGAQCRPIVGH